MNLATAQLREEGHSLIEQIEATGIPKKVIYERLDNWLGEKPHHFSQMNAERSRKANKCLKKMLELRKAGKIIPTRYPYYLYE